MRQSFTAEILDFRPQLALARSRYLLAACLTLTLVTACRHATKGPIPDAGQKPDVGQNSGNCRKSGLKPSTMQANRPRIKARSVRLRAL